MCVLGAHAWGHFITWLNILSWHLGSLGLTHAHTRYASSAVPVTSNNPREAALSVPVELVSTDSFEISLLSSDTLRCRLREGCTPNEGKHLHEHAWQHDEEHREVRPELHVHTAVLGGNNVCHPIHATNPVAEFRCESASAACHWNGWNQTERESQTNRQHMKRISSYSRTHVDGSNESPKHGQNKSEC